MKDTELHSPVELTAEQRDRVLRIAHEFLSLKGVYALPRGLEAELWSREFQDAACALWREEERKYRRQERRARVIWWLLILFCCAELLFFLLHFVGVMFYPGPAFLLNSVPYPRYLPVFTPLLAFIPIYLRISPRPSVLAFTLLCGRHPCPIDILVDMLAMPEYRPTAIESLTSRLPKFYESDSLTLDDYQHRRLLAEVESALKRRRARGDRAVSEIDIEFVRAILSYFEHTAARGLPLSRPTVDAVSRVGAPSGTDSVARARWQPAQQAAQDCLVRLHGTSA